MSLKHKLSALLLFFMLTLTAQEQIFPYRDGNLWGLCDEKANILVTPKYDVVKNIKSKGKTFFEATLDKNTGVFIGLKNVIPVEYHDLRYVSNNLIIAVKKDTNNIETSYLYNTNGHLLIKQPLSLIKGIKGNDNYDTSFIIGFYIKDLEGKSSLINLDSNNNNQITYLIKDVFLIGLDNKNSKEELAIANIKQTATSPFEKKYFKIEGSKIILLDPIKDSQYIEENSGKKKGKYQDYDNNVAVPDMGGDMIMDVAPTVSENRIENGEIKNNTLKRKPIKNIAYFKNTLKENEIDIEISNVTKSKKTVKFPFKANKLEVFQIKRMLYDEKLTSDTLKKYSSYIIYQKKNKFGLVYKFPFEKSIEYDFLETIKSEKKYYSLDNIFFKIGILNKKDKTMKFGIIDANHTVVLPAEYNEIKMGFTITSSYKEQVFLVQKNNLFGLISEKKEIKLPIEFDSINFESKNQSFLKVKKGSQHSAYISYYSNGNYILTLLPSYFNYPIKEITYKISSGKKEITLLEAIEYITLEDEKGNFKGYANPDGTLYFKD